MPKHHGRKKFKGCCPMCGSHTLYGTGLPVQRSGSELKRAFSGKKRRVKRNDVPNEEEW